MKQLARSTTTARWITLADAITLTLLALAAAIFVTGGVRGRVWGVTISITGAWRPALLAVVVSALRHAAFRDNSLWQRVKRWLGPLGDPFLDRRVAAPITASELALVTALMLGLTAVMTYPQVSQLGDVLDFGDPLFSLWRLAWIAHQLVRDPLNLFNANLYYPAQLTLAYSDSMLLPGLLTAPFFWLGVPSLPLYGATVLATFVLAGVAMYVLVRWLTGQPPAALVAAVAFAFCSFRYQHYFQLELLWACWMPLTLLGVHRTIARGRVRDGLMFGGAFAAQMLSCVYFGLFLAAYLVPVGGALAIGFGRVKSAVKPLAAGAILATILVIPMGLPYLHVRQAVGERSLAEVDFYSSKPQDYLVAQNTNAAWGNLLGREASERDASFPGVLIVVLALVALWPPLSVPRIAYALGLIFAFDVSLGSNGYVFPILYRWIIPFRGLRAPGRMSMLVGMSLAVLGGYGVARLTAHMRRGWHKCLFAALVSGVVLFESRTVLTLQYLPPPNDVYHWFAGRPPGVLAELPADDDHEARYTYLSTVHWQRIVNGYSGVSPIDNAVFKRLMATFPDAPGIQFLRDRHVDYIVVHEDYYGRLAYRSVIEAVDKRSDLRECARAVTDGYEARIYQLIK